MTGDVASATGVPIEPRECAAFAWRPWLLLGTLVVGYIGIYLCRKNFSVANPLIRQAFGLSKEQIVKQAFVTPSCGTGSLPVADAERVFSLLRQTSEALRKDVAAPTLAATR